jgi:tRNA 5-methylaminomethyl-2-thiouridine biosynthesis bifunctional protein
MKLIPAELAFDASGTPYSHAYDDVYHSADSGPGQARHVFLGGNRLPANWAGKGTYTIVETGFGLGLNFLATWQAWRGDGRRPRRLHFVSIERHPLSRAALTAAHERYAELHACAQALQAVWPQALPGMHRREFEDGGVVLTLVFADVTAALPRLRLAADAFFLDGFAPARNSEMWSPWVMKALARLAVPGATVATYTAARAVRDALAQAGFVVERRVGYGRKRDMLCGRFAPRWVPRHTPPCAPQWRRRSALVIGAGLAGAAVSERLSARGWSVVLIERNGAPAAGASGMHAGVYQPQLSRDDNVTSRLARAGFLYGIENWRAVRGAGHGFAWDACGVLRVAKDARDAMRMAETVTALGYPATYAECVEPATARRLSGCNVNVGGWWFPGAGWVRPATLVAAQLARVASSAPGLTAYFGTAVGALKRDGGLWHALAADGAVIASAEVAVLANADDASRFVELGQTLRRVRGQATYLPASAVSAPRAVVTGAGYWSPAINGLSVIGASYDFDDDESGARSDGHLDNLARIASGLHVDIADVDATALAGEVGFRCVAPDRLPLIGALPDFEAIKPRAQELAGAHAPDLPRLPGFYGAFAYASRGLTWAALGGELLASLIEGEPPPVESDLVDAVDPGRFVLKLVRRGKPGAG